MDLRVMTSYFSGVVTMIWVSAICCLVSCESPVSSPTWKEEKGQSGTFKRGSLIE